MLSAAWALAVARVASARQSMRIVFMAVSILVGAVRAEAEDVLHEPLVVGGARQSLAAGVLQADAAELRGRVIHHHARASGPEIDRVVEGSVRGGIRVSRIEPIEPQPRAPFGQ